MLHLYYCVWSALLAERANTVTIVQTCHALALAQPDWRIDLCVTELPVSPQKVFAAFGKTIPPNLRVRLLFPEHVEHDDLLDNKPRARVQSDRRIEQTSWREELSGKKALIYTRNRALVSFFRELGGGSLPIVLELHQLKYPRTLENKRNKNTSLQELKETFWKYRSREISEIGDASFVFCISKPLEAKLSRVARGVETDVLPCGCVSARDPEEGTTRDIDLLYVGQLYFWKGVHTVIEALCYCECEARLTIVGGNNPVDAYANKKLAENLGVMNRIDWVGQVPHAKAMEYQRRAKIGLIPLPGQYFITRCCTSPVKAFELMSRGATVLASDLPSIRSILTHGVTAHFARPDTPRDWARQIDFLLGNDTYRLSLASEAAKFASSFTYEQRVEKMARTIEKRLLGKEYCS